MDEDASTECTDCEDGKYNSEGMTVCNDCPAGTADLTGADPNVVCTNCVPGQYAAAGTTSCDDCQLGEYNDIGPGFPCKSCAVGYFSPVRSTLCTQCLGGWSDADSTPTTDCTECDAGKHSLPGAYGADETRFGCVSCRIGWNDHDSMPVSPCVQCISGRFQAEASQTDCDMCPMGTFQPNSGHGVCIDCIAGKFLDIRGGISNEQCEDCMLGKWSELAARTSANDCIACTPGTYVDLTGSNEEGDCIECAAGKFAEGSANDEAEACIECLAGTWQPNTRATLLSDCIACIAGKYSTRVASVTEMDCIECGRGKWSGATANDEESDCIACIAGTFVGVTGSTRNSDCIDCVAGLYSPVPASDACTDCVPGQYQGQDMQTECIECDPTYYQGAVRATECIQCVAGTYQPAAASLFCEDCTAGQYAPAGSLGCTTCAGGEHDHDALPSTPCEACASGTFSTARATDCQLCQPGWFDADSDPATPCEECASGRSQPQVGQTECPECSEGRYQNRRAQPTCMLCAVGDRTDCPIDQDCVGSWAPCNEDCQKVFSIYTQQSGNGLVCDFEHGATDESCSPGEVLCPLDIDCVASWSVCDAACSQRYAITVAHSGQGTACEADEGGTRPCNPGEGACPSDSCQGSWSTCGANCEDKLYTITQLATGNGVECVASHGDRMACLPGEDECPPDIDCVGSWSSCDRSCVRTYSISVEKSGQGQACESTQGGISGCAAGVDDCAQDVDCLGHWSTCASDCSDRMHSIIRSVSGNGEECEFADGETTPCLPGEGACPANVDCVGSWTSCDATCTKLYVIHTFQSGEGQSCPEDAGTTAACSDEPCDDLNDETVDDTCSSSQECEGLVMLGAQMSYDLDISEIPGAGSAERAALDDQISTNLAIVLSAGGMSCTASSISVDSIAFSVSGGRRRVQSGGNILIDYTVAVAPEFSTPEIRATARAAIEDPASVGVAANAMTIVIGGTVSGAPQTMHFRSYSWVLTAATCPTQCGTDASDRGDMYTCEEDGIMVENNLCVDHLGEIPETNTHCPATDDCPCIGEWSTCLPDCSDKAYTVTREAIGNVGNGAPCEANHGDMARCAAGEGQCPPNVNCFGTWSICDASCVATYTIYEEQSGLGTDCVASDGDTVTCGPEFPCDDGIAQTMNDICSASAVCSGRVTLAGELVYAMTVESIPARGTSERTALENQISTALAGVLTLGTMVCSAEDIEIVSIVGGSVTVGYAVTVAPEFATPLVRVNAQAAIEDPASVGAAANAMSITIGGQTAASASVAYFSSYAWVVTRATCPAECGVDESDPADLYTCEEDGVEVDNTLCEQNVSPIFSSTTHCGATEDCTCAPVEDCIPGRTDCTREGEPSCSQCMSGFYVDGSTCNQCEDLANCVPGRTECGAGGSGQQCVECLEGYSLHSDGMCTESPCTLTAADTPANGMIGTCTSELQSRGQCQMQCTGGYRLQAGLFSDLVVTTCVLGVLRTPVCEMCPAGQYKPGPPNTATECQECPQGWTSEQGQTDCRDGIPCTPDASGPRGTTLAHSPTTCSGVTNDVCDFQCNPGYEPIGQHICMVDQTFRGGACSAMTCTGSTTLNSSDVVCAGTTGMECSFDCICGYEKTGTHICGVDQHFDGGLCNECPSTHSSDGTACSVCPDGMQPTPSRCGCIACPAGTAGVGGLCEQCEQAKAPSNTSTTCDTCPTGRVSPDGIACEACSAVEYTRDNINCVQADDGQQPCAGVDRTAQGHVFCAAGSDQEHCNVVGAGFAGMGGVCERCPPGYQANVPRTVCEPCERLFYNSDGEGCVPCPGIRGSVPGNVEGATFCVSCSLQGEPETAGARFANTDWPACELARVECEPGQQLLPDLSGCENCADLGPGSENKYSPQGVRCEQCPPGKMPDETRSSCMDCFGGTYSPMGNCIPCLELGDNFYSEPGATRCLSCGVGTEPSVDQSSCRMCQDGYFSPYGVCQACPAGRQSDPSRGACVGCAVAGLAYHSVDGSACTRCEDGKQPLESREDCEHCPDGSLGRDGLCVEACEALACTNLTLSTSLSSASVSSIDEICERATSWASTSDDKTVGDDSGLCTQDSCEMELGIGTTPITISGTSNIGGASCDLYLSVRVARIDVNPTYVETESDNLNYADVNLRVFNEGDDPVDIYGVDLPNAPWISVAQARAASGDILQLPAQIESMAVMFITLRAAGTAAPAGVHIVNGTVLSSNTNEDFDIVFTITPATLRVVALPSEIPQVTVRAGDGGASAFATIYNVDTMPIRWWINNCSLISGPTGSTALVAFSNCGGDPGGETNTQTLELGASTPVNIRFNSPSRTGLYITDHEVVGLSTSDSKWRFSTTVEVLPNELVPENSEISMDAVPVAGSDAIVVITPRDAYSNDISSFGLTFVAVANETATDAGFEFQSEYDFDTLLYTATINVPTFGPYRYAVSVAGVTLQPVLFPDVRAVTCDEVSEPNEFGNRCICIPGYARNALGVCDRCNPGQAPKANREEGCESCEVIETASSTPNDPRLDGVSANGQVCESCPTGLRPNSARDSCRPCPDNQYYDPPTAACRPCEAGKELNEGGNPAMPCRRCNPFSAGQDGTCATCPSGTKTNDLRTQCNPCDIGFAGANGVCQFCPPGTYQKPNQFSCVICDLDEEGTGTYRNEQVTTECLKCPKGMIAQPGSTHLSDCYCPAGRYDATDDGVNQLARHDTLLQYMEAEESLKEQCEERQAARGREVVGVNEDTGEPECTQAEKDMSVRSPIWCWPNGREKKPQVIDANEPSVMGWMAGERCVLCPDCLQCDVTVETGNVWKGECTADGQGACRSCSLNEKQQEDAAASGEEDEDEDAANVIGSTINEDDDDEEEEFDFMLQGEEEEEKDPCCDASTCTAATGVCVDSGTPAGSLSTPIQRLDLDQSDCVVNGSLPSNTWSMDVCLDSSDLATAQVVPAGDIAADGCNATTLERTVRRQRDGPNGTVVDVMETVTSPAFHLTGGICLDACRFTDPFCAHIVTRFQPYREVNATECEWYRERNQDSHASCEIRFVEAGLPILTEEDCLWRPDPTSRRWISPTSTRGADRRGVCFNSEMPPKVVFEQDDDSLTDDMTICVERDAYRGRPFAKEGWTTVNPRLEDREATHPVQYPQSSLVQPEYFVPTSLPRDVFKCPYGVACTAEIDFRDADANKSRCMDGFEGPVCGYCSDDWALKPGGCTECAPAYQILIGYAIFFGSIIMIVVGVKTAIEKNKKTAEIVGVIGKIIPEIIGDVQIFIGVYQVFSGMGTTLRVEYPLFVQQFIESIRMWVNFDLFSAPGLSCLSPPSFYSKMWGQVIILVGIVLFIWLNLKKQLIQLHLDHIEDPDKDAAIEEHLKHQHHLERKAKHSAEADTEYVNGLKSHKNAGEESDEHKQALDAHTEGAFDDHDDAKDMQERLIRMQTRATLRQNAFGTAQFVIFLVYPALTNTIFAVFDCYDVIEQVDDEHDLGGATQISFLNPDYRQSCQDDTYFFNRMAGTVFMILIPIGVPVVFGGLIVLHWKDILEHHGPHYLESLYGDYTPECCMWEVYQMIQKVTLVGLLTFIDQGSILQCVVGFVVSNFVLLMMVRNQPYLALRTNVLAIAGQSLIVIAYLASMLLRIDLSAEVLKIDHIGMIIIGANIPMTLYLMYDTYITLREELHAAKIDLLHAELGDVGSKYRCLLQSGVPVSRHLKRSHHIGRIKHHEVVTSIGQAIVFQKGGAVAKLQTEKGWCSYNHHGMMGHRYFVLVSTANAHGEKMGSVSVHLKYNKIDGLLHATVLNCNIDGALQKQATLPDEERTPRAGMYVVIRVNGDAQRTDVTQLSKPEWNDGTGQTLIFDTKGSHQKGLMESIIVKLYGVDLSPDWLTKDSEDLIGIHPVGLEDYFDEDEWEIEAIGTDAFPINEELGVLPEDLHPDNIDADEAAPEDGSVANPMLSKPGKKGKIKKKGKGGKDTAANPMFKGESRRSQKKSADMANVAAANKAAKKLKGKTRHFQCVKVSILRKEAGMKSKKVGQLKQGEVVEVTDETTLPDGTVRLQVGNRGWCSKVSSQGDVIMQKVKFVPKDKAKAAKEKKEKKKKAPKKKAAPKGETMTNPMFAAGADDDSDEDMSMD